MCSDVPLLSPRRSKRSRITIHDDGDNDVGEEEHGAVDSERAPNAATIKPWTRHSDLPSRDTHRVALSLRHGNGQSLQQSPPSRRGRTKELQVVSKEAVSEENEDRENIPQLPTPKTPRHRDALSKRVPITPRHRIGLVSQPLTPRSSHKISTPQHKTSVYSAARQLFTRSKEPSQLVGRTDEREELTTFFQTRLSARSGGALYVSGPPGTGKSALVSEVFQNAKGATDVLSAYLNCMSVKRSADVFEKISEELFANDASGTVDVSSLETKLAPTTKEKKTMYMVVLDEIDHLLTLDPQILYKIFEWSLHRFSRLIVVGIANALDLADRFLPLLKARNLRPQLLPFLPYTAAQIAEVMTSKLLSFVPQEMSRNSKDVPFFQSAAIQLCSKKVASQTGDLRKAFDIMRRTLDLVEGETRQNLKIESEAIEKGLSPSKSPLAENRNLSSSPSSQTPASPRLFTSLTPLTAPKATIAHVSRVSAAAFSNGTSQRLQTLHLQQKAALCAIISHQKRLRNASSSSFSIFPTPTKKSLSPFPTLKELHETYCALCKRENSLHPLSATEFADVIGGLETLGLLSQSNGDKGPSFLHTGTPSRKKKSTMATSSAFGGADERRVVSYLNEAEIEACLNGPGGDILRDLLHGDD